MDQPSWWVFPIILAMVWWVAQLMFGGVRAADQFNAAFPSEEEARDARGREGCINIIFGLVFLIWILRRILS